MCLIKGYHSCLPRDGHGGSCKGPMVTGGNHCLVHVSVKNFKFLWNGPQIGIKCCKYVYLLCLGFQNSRCCLSFASVAG